MSDRNVDRMALDDGTTITTMPSHVSVWYIYRVARENKGSRIRQQRW